MKKQFVILFSFLFLSATAAWAGPADAQKIHSVFSLPGSIGITVKAADLVKLNAEDKFTLTPAYTRAQRDFHKKFMLATGEKWYEIRGGMLVSFKTGENRNSVVYDKKGIWQYSLRYINEKEVPKEVRGSVKREYYDYSIKQVDEIQIPEGTVYFFHLEDDQSFKNVRVFENEMVVLDDFKKPAAF